MMDRQTDRLTDTQTQGEKQYVSRPLQGGDIIFCLSYELSKEYFIGFIVDIISMKNVLLLPVFGVRVLMMFPLTCVHIILVLVSAAEWPPFGK